VFESVGQWDLLLPVLGAAVAAGAVWAGTRQLTRVFSIEARAERQARARLRLVARQAGLRVDEEHLRLHGRVAGWAVTVTREWKPLRTGGVAGEHWHIRLFADAPANPRALSAPPPHVAPVTRAGGDLVATLPIAREHHLAGQLAWMAELATQLHTPLKVEGQAPDALSSACTDLGLHADPALPRWDGRWSGRNVLVERLDDRGHVHVQLGLEVVLPPGFWVGGRDTLNVSGDPVPLPLQAASGSLAASASPTGVEATRELLQDTALIDILATHVADVRGSQVFGGVVSLVRPAVVFSVAPLQVLRAARAVARALEHAVERPWRAFAATQGLRVSDARSGGYPVLSGTRHGFDLDLRHTDHEGTVTIRATPVDHPLVNGLAIVPGKGQGYKTFNPILDQHISVRAAHPPSREALARLPADALLPLLLEHAGTRVGEEGVLVRLPAYPSTRAMADVLHDLDRLLPTLPRAATSA